MSSHPQAFVYQVGSIQLAEFDLGGVLYHANYFRLFERAREALLESIGFPYPTLVANGYHLAVASSTQQFLLPIFYGESLEIGITLPEIGSASLTMDYEVRKVVLKETRVAHQAKLRFAFVHANQKELRTHRIPQNLSNALLSINLKRPDNGE